MSHLTHKVLFYGLSAALKREDLFYDISVKINLIHTFITAFILDLYNLTIVRLAIPGMPFSVPEEPNAVTRSRSFCIIYNVDPTAFILTHGYAVDIFA